MAANDKHARSDGLGGLETFATLDHDRAGRCGHGEVVYAAGKQPAEVVLIIERLLVAGEAGAQGGGAGGGAGHAVQRGAGRGGAGGVRPSLPD